MLSAGATSAASASAGTKPKAQSQAQGARRLSLGVAGLALGIDKEVAIALDDLGDKI